MLVPWRASCSLLRFIVAGVYQPTIPHYYTSGGGALRVLELFHVLKVDLGMIFDFCLHFF